MPTSLHGQLVYSEEEETELAVQALLDGDGPVNPDRQPENVRAAIHTLALQLGSGELRDREKMDKLLRLDDRVTAYRKAEQDEIMIRNMQSAGHHTAGQSAAEADATEWKRAYGKKPRTELQQSMLEIGDTVDVEDLIGTPGAPGPDAADAEAFAVFEQQTMLMVSMASQPQVDPQPVPMPTAAEQSAAAAAARAARAATVAGWETTRMLAHAQAHGMGIGMRTTWSAKHFDHPRPDVTEAEAMGIDTRGSFV
tara:strand:- start:1006 stop:1764 length:759 start_codon:yes stop_codon:yes gene_type:complete